MLDRPFALGLEEWEIWEKETSKKYPIRFFLSITLPRFLWGIYYRIGDVKWWFFHRFHPSHRNHVIKTRLPPGYYDKDDLMFHACFTLLQNFVELEQPFDIFETSEPHWTEIKNLYDWWKERALRQDPWDVEEARQAFNITIERDKEDQEMLMRLIAVRQYLWT